MASNGILKLDYFHKYLISTIPVNILEIAALLSGIYYLKKTGKPLAINKYLVVVLWYTVISDLIGAYAPIGYFSDYKYFGFVKDTLIVRNLWLYNCYFLISYSFFIYYFISYLTNEYYKKIAKYVIGLYVISGISYIIISNTFFTAYSIFSITVGSLLLLISIILFYLDVLKSDEIIKLKRYLPIYISIGVLFFNLCVVPLQLFSKYFKAINELYVNISSFISLIGNVFMYSAFIIGFLMCTPKRKTKQQKV